MAISIKRNVLTLVSALLLLGVCTASVAGKPHGPFGHVQLMEAMGSLIVQLADIQIQANEVDDQSKNLDEMAKNFRGALADARGHASLTKAVKEYYASVRAFLTGLQPQADEAVIVYHARISGLETNINNAKASLDTELQALGVNP